MEESCRRAPRIAIQLLKFYSLQQLYWPNPTPTQKESIEKAAQAVLDARKLYPDSTLADLYDPNTMPPELTKAHEKLDKAVKVAYGNKGFETEEEIVAILMKLYKEAVDEKNYCKDFTIKHRKSAI